MYFFITMISNENSLMLNKYIIIIIIHKTTSDKNLVFCPNSFWDILYCRMFQIWFKHLIFHIYFLAFPWPFIKIEMYGFWTKGKSQVKCKAKNLKCNYPYNFRVFASRKPQKKHFKEMFELSYSKNIAD